MRFDTPTALQAAGFKPRVVIVGSGPAGLTLAMRLAERGVPSLVIEAGGFEYSEDSQAHFRGQVVGDPYFALDRARLRQFGGTSGHWTGWCRALDVIDFEERPGIPNSGWPIRKSDLDPYADGAAKALGVTLPFGDAPLTPDVDAFEMKFSAPVRFGFDYRRPVEQSSSIGLLLDCAVTELVPGDARIDELVVVDRERRTHRIRVEHVCLATGGIENSRLLLWSNRRHGGRVVPRATALGRYWMEHPSFQVASAVMANGTAERFNFRKGHMFAPAAAAIRSREVGNAQIWVRPMEPDSRSAKDLVHDLMCVAPAFSDRLYRLRGRELRCGAGVFMEWEQLPLAENRVELGTEADALGMPRARLHWKKSDADRRTAFEVTRLFGEALIRQDLGRLRMLHWLIDGEPFPAMSGSVQGAAWHHMGGTRMASSPEHGVVDRDCKVFGISNLHIAGSSVFSTGGHANPTFTIVQLALRLADHLASRVA